MSGNQRLAIEAMPTMRRWRVILVIGAAIIGSALIHLHIVSDNAGATLFQRHEEAYLFLGGGHTGWHFPVVAYPLVLAKTYLRIPTESSDQNAQSLVIRVTPKGVQRWMNQAPGIADLTPFEDGFYARCPGSELCIWTERGFVRVPPDEERRINIDSLYTGSYDNKVVNGWTAQVLKLTPGEHFEIQLDNNLTIAVQNYSERDWAHPSVRVDLLRPGQAPETLYRTDGTPRLVTRSAYEQIFLKR